MFKLKFRDLRMSKKRVTLTGLITRNFFTHLIHLITFQDKLYLGLICKGMEWNVFSCRWLKWSESRKYSLSYLVVRSNGRRCWHCVHYFPANVTPEGQSLMVMRHFSQLQISLVLNGLFNSVVIIIRQLMKACWWEMRYQLNLSQTCFKVLFMFVMQLASRYRKQQSIM